MSQCSRLNESASGTLCENIRQTRLDGAFPDGQSTHSLPAASGITKATSRHISECNPRIRMRRPIATTLISATRTRVPNPG